MLVNSCTSNENGKGEGLRNVIDSNLIRIWSFQIKVYGFTYFLLDVADKNILVFCYQIILINT